MFIVTFRAKASWKWCTCTEPTQNSIASRLAANILPYTLGLREKMEKIFGQDDPAIAKYAVETFKPEDDLLKEIHERSVNAGLPEIQVGTMDGLHLEVIARAIGAKKAVEIGTLGGYSGVCLCRGMGPTGARSAGPGSAEG